MDEILRGELRNASWTSRVGRQKSSIYSSLEHFKRLAGAGMGRPGALTSSDMSPQPSGRSTSPEYIDQHCCSDTYPEQELLGPHHDSIGRVRLTSYNLKKESVCQVQTMPCLKSGMGEVHQTRRGKMMCRPRLLRGKQMAMPLSGKRNTTLCVSPGAARNDWRSCL